MAKAKKKDRWAASDRYPVIFWIPGKAKRALVAKAKARKTSVAAMFRKAFGIKMTDVPTATAKKATRSTVSRKTKARKSATKKTSAPKRVRAKAEKTNGAGNVPFGVPSVDAAAML